MSYKILSSWLQRNSTVVSPSVCRLFPKQVLGVHMYSGHTEVTSWRPDISPQQAQRFHVTAHRYLSWRWEA